MGLWAEGFGRSLSEESCWANPARKSRKQTQPLTEPREKQAVRARVRPMALQGRLTRSHGNENHLSRLLCGLRGVMGASTACFSRGSARGRSDGSGGFRKSGVRGELSRVRFAERAFVAGAVLLLCAGPGPLGDGVGVCGFESRAGGDWGMRWSIRGRVLGRTRRAGMPADCWTWNVGAKCRVTSAGRRCLGGRCRRRVAGPTRQENPASKHNP